MPKGQRNSPDHYAKHLRRELERVGPRPKLADVAANFIAEAGGPKRFAALLWKEFGQADPGSSARKGILQIVAQALKTDTDNLSSDALDDLEDEDIDRMVGTEVKKLMEMGVINGETNSTNEAQEESEAEPEGPDWLRGDA